MRTNVCGREGACEEDEGGAEGESRRKYLWWRGCMRKERRGGVMKCVVERVDVKRTKGEEQ